MNRLVRNYAVAQAVKSLYSDMCQICGLTLLTAAGRYSEAAHIRPLGIPHKGPDSLANLLCLCPNCHVQFDEHALSVASDGTVLKFGEPAGKLFVKEEHQLGYAHLAYQREVSEGKTMTA